MKVKDIMTKNVITVDLKMKIEEVASILTENRIHGVPVVKKDKVIGIITETDFFVKDSSNIYLPSFINFIKKTKVDGDIDRDKKNKINELVKTRAEDIMTNSCMTVFPDMEVEQVLNVFKESGFHTLPVVDEDDSLCGIITLADIISIIGKLK